MPEISFPPWSLGAVLAVIVLIVALVLALMGQMTWPVAGCLMGLAIARMT